MNAERWTRIRDILEDALEQPPEMRSRFVGEACAGDPQLEREVREYLGYEEVAQRDLSLSRWLQADSEPAEAIADPERIGNYGIVRRLGEGGMGVVYLAERDDAEYRQRVALKVLKPGGQTGRLLKLFRRERQILAHLQHPGIARLMDGGTVNGQAFYVMEYVEGTSVNSYCQEHRLDVRQRLQLFCEICEAVSYAHRKLIIHRDLKPSNILVTAEGRPKLLDFGLGKMFEEDALTVTASMGPMMTPAYASPEQVRGEHLSTATDVYSLGVLLYELLSGDNPQSADGDSPLEVCRTILEDEPPPPSHVVESAARRQLSGDLDAIVLMALRKEAERRYASVDEFRQDIQRFLDGFPVRATRGSSVYGLRKYLSRHRWRIAVAALSVVLAAGAGTTVWWEGRQAEMRFNDVRGLAHAVIFELHDAIRDLRGSTAARKLIVERALEYLHKLEARGVKKRELQLEMAGAYQKIGDVQGAMAAGNLGETAGAAQSYEQALHLLQLLSAPGDDLEAMRTLAEVDESLAKVVLKLGNVERHAKLWREATGLRKKLAQKQPHTPDAHALLLRNVAEGAYLAHDWSSAAPALRDALAAYQELALRYPQDSSHLPQMAKCNRLLSFVELQLGNHNEALGYAREALRLDTSRIHADPKDRNAQMDAASDWNRIGSARQELSDLRGAISSYQQAANMAQRLLLDDPQDADAALHAGAWLGDVAEVSTLTGDLSTAEKFYAEATKIFDTEFSHDPQNTQARGLFAYYLAQWADLEANKKTVPGWRRAAARYERAMELFEPLRPVLDLNEQDMATKADLPRRLALCRSQLNPKR